MPGDRGRSTHGRIARVALVAAGALLVAALVRHFGTASIAAALAHVTWWEFAVICLIHTLNVAVDTYGWRHAIARDSVPLLRLMAARCAGDAVNVLGAAAAVGTEATKAWLLRREIPYAESVPSLIIAKSAELVAQVLLLAVAIVVAAATDAVGPGLRTAMLYLLVVEVIAVAGFLAVQIGGAVGRSGRALAWIGVESLRHAEQLDHALRDFYRQEWRRFALSVGLYFVGWLLGAVQAVLILYSLGLAASPVAAVVIEALWSAVRFATFYVPASLGTLEGATAAAFGAFGFGASAGLAFTLVRRGSQMVWIGIGFVCLVVMRQIR